MKLNRRLIVAALTAVGFVPGTMQAQYVITTVAGNGNSVGPPDDNTQATAVALVPLGVSIDGVGNLYLIDGGSANASGPRPSTPRKVDTSGVITTLGCNGGPVLGIPPTPDSAPAMSVSCGNLSGVAVDSSFNIYFTQGGGRTVDVINPSETVTILTQQVDVPQNAVTDSSGNAYVADHNNCRVVKTHTSGGLTIVAGIGSEGVNCGFFGDGGPATSAELNFPSGVAVDSLGNLYIADTNNLRIRKVDASGIITTVAGNGSACNSGPGDTPIDNVPATESGVCPTGVAVDTVGNLYIADNASGRIRKVDTSGIITTIAGGGTNGLGDGGPATSAQLQFPFDLVVAPSGNIYVSDSGNNRVRLLTPAATIVKDVSITSTGFLYSRVTRTFNGAISITNTGSQPTPASLQLVLTSLAAGVTLENASGTFDGNPFITIPGVTTLAPGQSVAVGVKFSDPAKTLITFTPVIYSGSL